MFSTVVLLCALAFLIGMLWFEKGRAYNLMLGGLAVTNMVFLSMC